MYKKKDYLKAIFSMSITNTIKRMPKIVLHDHLDGGLRPATIIELAHKYNLSLPADTPQQLAQWFVQESTSKDLHRCLRAFAITCSVMQSKEDIMRVTYEMMEDLHLDNVVYVETRFCPYLHTQQGLTMSEVVDSVLSGLQLGKEKFGVEYGLIICGIRNFEDNVNLEIAKLCSTHQQMGVVGFDFAGADKGFPLTRQTLTISYLQQHSIPFTTHAGEADDIHSIIEALDFRTLRIGHGCQLLSTDDIKLIESVTKRIKQTNTHIEVNISSNLGTGVISDYESHPIKYFLSNGISISINPDDRLMFNNTTSSEYLLVSQHYNITEQDLRQMNINAIKSSFASQNLKDQIIKQYYSGDHQE